MRPPAMRPHAPLDPQAIADVRRPFGTSRTLPAEAYRSRELYEWEQEHIFGGGWVSVGRTTDLLEPGQARALALGAETVLLTRDDHDVRAFSNVCRHRGHPLAEVGEAFDVRLIRCGYHAWTYRLDGTLRSAPSMTQTPDFDTADWPLVPLRLGEIAGWLFVDLSGTAPDIGDAYGNLPEVLAVFEPDRLVRMARSSYEVGANWKLLVENYHECYHCTSIHPALCEVTPVDSGSDYYPTGLWQGGTMSLKDHAETMSLTGQSLGVRFRGMPDDMARTVTYLGVWPNLLISGHPDYVMTHRLTPIAPDRTAVECDWLWAPESIERQGFDPAYAVDFWDLTNHEDWAACERVQSGTANRGFRPGPLSPWETSLYQFLTMVGQAYAGESSTAPTPPSSRAIPAPSHL